MNEGNPGEIDFGSSYHKDRVSKGFELSGVEYIYMYWGPSLNEHLSTNVNYIILIYIHAPP